NRCDDAVVRPISVGESKLLPIRRSRGYAPFPVRLMEEMRPVLAVGGELKATFCLTKGAFGYMSQHIGDMENWETLEAFGTAVRHFQHLFRVEVEGVACDLHPGYLGTGWAQVYAAEKGVPLIEIQHHEAHIASVMAEHRLGEDERVIGFAFDGTGYGRDGAIWGGEVLVGGYAGFERPYHLAYTPLAGGDVSVKRPYRLALAQLWAAGIGWDERLPAVRACPAAERQVLRQQLERDLNCVPTSSMGRLFDAVAALAGGRQMITYEGQAAIELEALVDLSVRESYKFEIGSEVFSAVPLIRGVVEDVIRGVRLPVIGAKFHNGVTRLIVELSNRVRAQSGLTKVALSGGVFQNVTLLEKTVQMLEKEGFRPLIHERVPPNDGGLALGQAVLAEKQLVHG
ncbi:MAG: carbamoyltransferase HypF, partial [Anaerolineales bacterium]|nr:carbamoyltransferase HypF [Anaerolineales bacterium]